ncbi:MAG: diadenylate cyclase, partial [Bacteroidota bacterium]|nr:diadenylate cyclase [Bacteroidota bacterium]
RAAVGVSERSDAVCLIVSEETGAMSIAHEGKLEYNVSPDQFYKAIVAHLK